MFLFGSFSLSSSEFPPVPSFLERQASLCKLKMVPAIGSPVFPLLGVPRQDSFWAPSSSQFLFRIAWVYIIEFDRDSRWFFVPFLLSILNLQITLALGVYLLLTSCLEYYLMLLY